MTPALTESSWSALTTTWASWAHAALPAGSARFEGVVLFSLACYLLFAVVAMHYAFKTWAEKVMVASMAAGVAASLLLHGSLRTSPTYVGEGALWKFVALSQYLPWAAAGVGGVYLCYRLAGRLRSR